MAKVTIAGDAVVITSALKLEDIRLVKKYRPEALILKDEDDEPIFGIGITNGPGCINNVGVSFGRETRNDEKLAVVTMAIAEEVDDIEEYVVDAIGRAIINLNKLEAKLPEVIEAIAAEKAEILDSVTVAQ